MADHNHDVLAYFTWLSDVNPGTIVVTEAPKLDLETYISNYAAYTRFERLFLIGKSSVPLCVDALKAAIVEAKRGRDIQRYHDAVECLSKAAPNEPEAQMDQGWVNKTFLSNQVEHGRLDADLKGYKNNLIKESIRIGLRDLGEFFESIGDLLRALGCFQQMRSEACTHGHLVDVSKHIIGILIRRKDLSAALATVNKMLPATMTADEVTMERPYQKIATGIVLLGLDRYYEAARSFTETGSLGAAARCNDMVTPNDVATYGGLLALATMDRNELQLRVLDNSSFRGFLELESHIRKALSMFVNGRYSACLAILESYKADYLLDVHLQPHVGRIYDAIRTKCIVQYFKPFSRVTLASMNAAFGKPGESLEQELLHLIRSGVLEARINTMEKLLEAIPTNRRADMQADALKTVEGFEQEALDQLRRISLASANLLVKGAPARKALAGAIDTWMDDGQGRNVMVPDRLA